jgi:transcriptional antiterminator RfaH
MKNSSDYWYVLYTKPNAELKVAQRLLNIGVQSFAPTRIEYRKWSDRVRKLDVPLLTSMVLVQLAPVNFNDVFEVPGVVRYLFFNGEKARVKQEELVAMQFYVSQKHKLEKEILRVGDIVDVPHLESKGELLRIKGEKCLVKLEKLGYTVSFKLV